MIDNEFMKWIKPYFKKLYYCQKNDLLPVFKTTNVGHHGRRRPDYIFQTFKGVWGCIEFEPGETYGEITTGAVQLNDIYKLLKNGLIFIVDGVEIKPELFFLATPYSKKGYLWKNDTRTVETSGYSESEPLKTQNTTVWHSTRWMWRFCGREQESMSLTNPNGVNHFSVIYSNWNQEPEVELKGHFKIPIKNL